MVSDRTSLVIGVDGGGTSCRAALLRGDARFDARGGAANVTSDFDGAIRCISALLQDLATQAGLAGLDSAGRQF